MPLAGKDRPVSPYAGLRKVGALFIKGSDSHRLSGAENSLDASVAVVLGQVDGAGAGDMACMTVKYFYRPGLQERALPGSISSRNSGLDIDTGGRFKVNPGAGEGGGERIVYRSTEPASWNEYDFFQGSGFLFTCRRVLRWIGERTDGGGEVFLVRELYLFASAGKLEYSEAIGSRLNIAAAYESLIDRFSQWIDNLRLNKVIRIEGLDDGWRRGGLHGRLNAVGGIMENQPPVPLIEAVEYAPDA